MGHKMHDTKAQLTRMAIGGAAGSVAKTCVAPFERVRIMAQTGGSAGTNMSMFEVSRLVFEKEGVVGFWRGNFVNIIRVFPSRGVLFSCNEVYKKVLFKRFSDSTSVDSGGKIVYPFWLTFSAGAMAGMSANVATYPLDVARTRMTANIVKKGDVGRSMVSTLSQMLVKEGLRSWYKGVGPTLAGSIPYEGIKFGVYDICNRLQRQCLDPSLQNPVMTKLISGGMAGFAAGMVMFPNDTVRRLLQMQGQHGIPVKYTSAWHCWKTVFKEEGFRRFFRGMSPYMLRMLPNSAIQFTFYGILSDIFQV